MPRSLPKALLLLLALAVIAGAGLFFLHAHEAPRPLTLTRMSALRRNILEYAREHHRLPENLATLPPGAEGAAALLDGWQAPIVYRIDPGDVITLTSAGPARPDMIGRFATRSPDGAWLEGSGGPWLLFPLDPVVPTYEDLRARARDLGETPAGRMYEAQFKAAAGVPLLSACKACAQNVSPPFLLDLVFEIAADGHPARIYASPQQPLSTCVAARMQDFVLPLPPRPAGSSTSR